jgi:hypothetical protein
MVQGMTFPLAFLMAQKMLFTLIFLHKAETRIKNQKDNQLVKKNRYFPLRTPFWLVLLLQQHTQKRVRILIKILISQDPHLETPNGYLGMPSTDTKPTGSTCSRARQPAGPTCSPKSPSLVEIG